MENRCLLALFSWLSQLTFLHKPGHLLKGGTARNGLGSPTTSTSVINRENVPHCPVGRSDGGSSSAEVSSSQVTMLCQVDKT